LLLCVLKQCSCIALLWWGKLREEHPQRIPWEFAVLFSFTVLLWSGCSLDMMLD
jgi:hypothetical protein